MSKSTNPTEDSGACQAKIHESSAQPAITSALPLEELTQGMEVSQWKSPLLLWSWMLFGRLLASFKALRLRLDWERLCENTDWSTCARSGETFHSPLWQRRATL